MINVRVHKHHDVIFSFHFNLDRESVLRILIRFHIHLSAWTQVSNLVELGICPFDFSIDSVHMSNLLEILSMPNFYYSYVKKNWRFIVLDATDVSYYANKLHQRTIEEIDAYYRLAEGKENHHPWNSGIGKKQQDWMMAELDEAQSLNQKVILFSHMPLRPEHMTNLWNCEEIAKIIEGFPNVVAFINGHNHEGGYVFHNGIHYITIFGMLDTEISSYGILDIYQDSLVIKGYGNQKSLSLIIHSSDK